MNSLNVSNTKKAVISRINNFKCALNKNFFHKMNDFLMHQHRLCMCVSVLCVFEAISSELTKVFEGERLPAVPFS